MVNAASDYYKLECEIRQRQKSMFNLSSQIFKQTEEIKQLKSERDYLFKLTHTNTNKLKEIKYLAEGYPDTILIDELVSGLKEILTQ